jgi:hypothetical protein
MDGLSLARCTTAAPLATDKLLVGSKIDRGTESDPGVLPIMTNIPAILIVEDEALVRLWGVGTFADAGFRVIEAIRRRAPPIGSRFRRAIAMHRR